MVQLVEINWDNFSDIMAIKVNEVQRGYIPEVSVFLAQAYVNMKNNYPDCCFGITDDQLVIGFTKIVFVPVDTHPLFSKKKWLFIRCLNDRF